MESKAIVNHWILEYSCRCLCKAFITSNDCKDPSRQLDTIFNILTELLKLCDLQNENPSRKVVNWLLLTELCFRLGKSRFDSMSNDLKPLSDYLNALCKDFAISKEKADQLTETFNKIQEVKGKNLRSRSLASKVEKEYASFLKEVKVVIREIFIKLGPSFLDELNSAVDGAGETNLLTRKDLLDLASNHAGDKSNNVSENKANSARSVGSKKQGVRKLYNPSRRIDLADLESQVQATELSDNPSRSAIQTSPSFAKGKRLGNTPLSSKRNKNESLNDSKEYEEKHHKKREKQLVVSGYTLRSSPIKPWNPLEGNSQSVKGGQALSQCMPEKATHDKRSGRKRSVVKPSDEAPQTSKEQNLSRYNLRSPSRNRAKQKSIIAVGEEFLDENASNDSAKSYDESDQSAGNGRNSDHDEDEDSVGDEDSRSDVSSTSDPSNYSNAGSDNGGVLSSAVKIEVSDDYGDDGAVRDNGNRVMNGMRIGDDCAKVITSRATRRDVKRKSAFYFASESEEDEAAICSKERSKRSRLDLVRESDPKSANKSRVVGESRSTHANSPRTPTIRSQKTSKRTKAAAAYLSDDQEEPLEDSILAEANCPQVQNIPQRRRPFSRQEEEWLIKGVKRFGVGKWKEILDSYSFSSRTSVNLKDKWRNLIRSGAAESIFH